MARHRVYDGRCNDCDQNHQDGASAIYCDWVRGNWSPSLRTNEQRAIAERFARERPDEAAAIAPKH